MKNIKELEELYARLDDLKKRAARGKMAVSAFLSPRELHYGELYLERNGVRFFDFGGYSSAERRRIYFLPEYMEGVLPAAEGTEEIFECFGESSDIDAVMVEGSGFFSLSHRDFMGSLLGLGIERSVVGDIIPLDNSRAVVICTSKISDFLITQWSEVGRDKVNCRRAVLDKTFSPRGEYANVNDTVASARIDCVVAALCNLSRDKARDCVISGLTELDYETEIRPDREIEPPCLVSVRGYGKFRVCSVEGQTKKGRYRLFAQKFL